MRTMPIIGMALAALAVGAAASAVDIPPRPEQLKFADLKYEVPDAAAMRVQLANGVPVYVAEDRLLPLITIQVMFRGGRYMAPAGKEGVAGLTSTVWRTGGAGALDSKALDEELDFLAAQLSTSIGGTSGMVTLNLLSKDIDRGLALLMDVLQRPRFDEARLATAREDMLAEMKRRNDDTESIESREWDRLIYGDDYWVNRLATKASVDGITRDDLVSFHRQVVNPANFVIAVAGDFERKAIVAKLDAAIGTWAATGPKAAAVPQPGAGAKPGVYLVNKPDVNQGRVSIGHLGVIRPVADEFALAIANDILGGGGFTAWMMSKIRSDEGLAYSAYSEFPVGEFYPSAFRAYFQSKSSTCARAAQLTRELVGRLRAQPVTDKELSTSKSSFVETLPRTFETKLRTASRYARDELIGLPHAYWTDYRKNFSGVGREAVQAAAAGRIKPDQLVVLVVGNIDEILKGSPDHPDAKLEMFGPLVRLPLRDPMTLEPLSAEAQQ